MKLKWIAGCLFIGLFSAIAASALTAVLLTRGLIVLPAGTASPTTATLPGPTTSETTAATQKPQPTPTTGPKPTPTTTPAPTPQPTGNVLPIITDDPILLSALEQYYIWQSRDLLERIYATVSLSVVGIKVDVGRYDDFSKRTNEGSGVIITEEGDIMTNASLLSIAVDNRGKLLASATITIYVQGTGKPFSATLVGLDRMTGLAVLHVEPGIFSLKAATFAEASNLKVGQRVLAIGYPELPYSSGSMTSGLISGLNYPVVLEDGNTMQLIQTNAPVNSASAGGPLLDLSGTVIGLTSGAVDAESQMTYALPGPEALKICLNLINSGHIAGRSWLGVTVLSEESFQDLQDLYGLPDGLFINGIVEESPAASVDLRKGDVITQFNGEAVGSPEDMYLFLQRQPVGTLVVITVYRRSDGQAHEIKVYLMENTG